MSVARLRVVEVTMHLDLSTEEARLLVHQLSRRLEDLDAELVHTDKRELQRSLRLLL